MHAVSYAQMTQPASWTYHDMPVRPWGQACLAEDETFAIVLKPTELGRFACNLTVPVNQQATREAAMAATFSQEEAGVMALCQLLHAAPPVRCTGLPCQLL